MDSILSVAKKATPAGAVLTAQDRYVSKMKQDLAGSIGTSFEPLVEKYIGHRVVVDVIRGEEVLPYSGVLKDYTAEFIETLDVDYRTTDDQSEQKADLWCLARMVSFATLGNNLRMSPRIGVFDRRQKARTSGTEHDLDVGSEVPRESQVCPDHPGLVRGLQRLGDLLRNRLRLIQWARPLRDQFGKGWSLDQLQDEGPAFSGMPAFRGPRIGDGRPLLRRERGRVTSGRTNEAAGRTSGSIILPMSAAGPR